MHYDVFNGDADGIIGLLQLRFAEPKDSTLITGVKRDIKLLKQVDGDKATSVTALDISMEKNLPELDSLLNQACRFFTATITAAVIFRNQTSSKRLSTLMLKCAPVC